MKHIGYSLIALLTAVAAARAQTSDLAISFNYPTNGAVFQSPAYLGVSATESSNTIITAEFFANGQTVRGLPPPSEADDGRTPTTDLQSNNHCPAKTHNVELVIGRSFYPTNTTPGPILNPAIAQRSRE